MKELLTNEQGGAIVIIFLILFPMLIMTNVYLNEAERLQRGSNITLKGNLTLAVKSASQSVEEKSQASGQPLIDPEFAHENFKKILAGNLKLDTDMSALNQSPIMEQINYYLLICNGKNSFNLPEGVIYQYKDNVLTKTNLSINQLPRTFGVNNSFAIKEGSKKVTLDKPGVIAIVEAKIKPMVIKENSETARWAAAKIVY